MVINISKFSYSRPAQYDGSAQGFNGGNIVIILNNLYQLEANKQLRFVNGYCRELVGSWPVQRTPKRQSLYFMGNTSYGHTYVEITHNIYLYAVWKCLRIIYSKCSKIYLLVKYFIRKVFFHDLSNICHMKAFLLRKYNIL